MLTTFNKAQAVPPFELGTWRSSWGWNAGCFVRDQEPTVAAKANIGAHELGHHLGLGHAGGFDSFGRWGNGWIDIGDTGSIMGSGGRDTLNRFTAAARFYLGVLPRSALSLHADTTGAVSAGGGTTASVVQRLRALSLGPDTTGATKLAMAFECPSCTPRDTTVTGASKKQLWIDFDDGFACNQDFDSAANALVCYPKPSVNVRFVYTTTSFGPTTGACCARVHVVMDAVCLLSVSGFPPLWCAPRRKVVLAQGR